VNGKRVRGRPISPGAQKVGWCRPISVITDVSNDVTMLRRLRHLWQLLKESAKPNLARVVYG
jgi:hypothetical protein